MSAATAFGVTAATAVAVSAGAGTASADMAIGCAQSGNLVTCGFQGVTTEQTLRIPRGVKSMRVTAIGGPGVGVGQAGGRGGIVETDLPVTPGSLLYIRVGVDGVGNGGGASTVSTRSIEDRAAGLASRLIVAPGGGGAAAGGVGGDAGLNAPESGGSGVTTQAGGQIEALDDLDVAHQTQLYLAGGDIIDGGMNRAGAGGRGGTVDGGGAGGKIQRVAEDGTIQLVSEGAPGTLGIGGEGDGSGGSGGAGYYGGGGGADGAAGGGGSYLVPAGGQTRLAEPGRVPHVYFEFSMGLDGMIGSFGSSGAGTLSSAFNSGLEGTTSSVFAS
ncbi:hypothetical protein [Rhodococcus gannanensis]|uniref:Glycine rich protein n=1 Tax=Rhodococcus gannanensis TaxID=1960308 RepID=A0ABW4P6N9_9NOCA